MNKNQRDSNRDTAKWLHHQQVCPECGERGLHYVAIPISLWEIMSGREQQGFWTCAKFYGADGRRLNQ
jgi:hypothetical protein